MRFGAMLQAYRKKAGLTQAQLAQRSGLPLRSLQNWEAGHRMPRAEALLALARAVGATVEQLLTQPPDAAPPQKRPLPKPRGRKPKGD
jgi:transcriptional regulator with XRE-family HTH domain